MKPLKTSFEKDRLVLAYVMSKNSCPIIIVYSQYKNETLLKQKVYQFVLKMVKKKFEFRFQESIRWQHGFSIQMFVERRLYELSFLKSLNNIPMLYNILLSIAQQSLINNHYVNMAIFFSLGESEETNESYPWIFVQVGNYL